MKLVFCLFMLLVAKCSYAKPIAEYIHVPLKGMNIAIDSSTNSILVEDVGHPAKFCDSESGFYCVISKGFEFAVPRNDILQESWQFNGKQYQVMRKLTLKGEYPAWIIEKTGQPNIWYLWSGYRGLIMFGKVQRGAKELQENFLLDGECGFSANASCKE